MIGRWINAGALRVQCKANARSVGSRGRPVPIVYSPSPIDPNAFDARPPEAMWGTVWQWMWEKLPENYELTAQRVPRTRMLNGREVFRGWTWVCPGRVRPDGTYIGCGRTCNRLFGPLPVWTMPQALNDRLEIEMEAESLLAGSWSPGFSDAQRGARSFACKACWGVRDVSLVGPDGWNAFVTHVTGGLLYGHEVERPVEIVPQRRRRQYAKRKARPALRRQQVRRLLLDGLSYDQIAQRLGISYAGVASTARQVYRDDGVRGRAAWLKLRESVRMRLGESP